MIGQWKKLFTPSTPFLMTTSCRESNGSAALRTMRVFQASRSSTLVWRGLPRPRGIREALASFPTHESHKRKKIGWAWIKTENCPRRVAIAEICYENKTAYALEIERTNQEHAILVLARNDLQRIGAGELQAFLLQCALR
jgi:hypothetical protein